MLGEIKATVAFIEVATKPISRWHRIFRGMLPYIQGAKTKFDLSFTALVDIDHNTDTLYAIQDSYGHKTPPEQIMISPLKKGNTRFFQTIDLTLYYSGDSFLTIWEQDGTEPPQTVYIFHTTSRNTIFLSVIALVLAFLAVFIGKVW
jgi:hypothetical protein